MSRNAFLVIAAALSLAATAEVARAQESDTLLVPDSCFVLSLPQSNRDRIIDRIELQYVQVQTKEGTAVGGPRVHIGMQPKGGDDLIPSEVSAPCQADGKSLACALKCDEKGDAEDLGRFRIEPEGKTGLRLHIETPLTLNACTSGEEPARFTDALVSETFLLQLAGASDCFH